MNGEPARALDSYDEALRLKPESLAALSQAAAVAESERALERSLSYWMRARKLSPDDPEILLGFGRVCLKMNLLEDAEPALTRAASLKPDDIPYQYTLAAVKVGKRQFESAQTLLESLVAKRPADAQLHYALGSVLYIRGRLAEAAERLKESARLNPDQARLALLPRTRRAGSGQRQGGHRAAGNAAAPPSRARAVARGPGWTADERQRYPEAETPAPRGDASERWRRIGNRTGRQDEWRLLRGSGRLRPGIALGGGPTLRCRRAVHRHHPDRRRRLSSTSIPPPRTSTCSRPWAAAWPCSTTTTTAAWICSSRTARGSTIRCRRGSGPTNRTRDSGTACTGRSSDGTFVDVTEKAGLSGMPQNASTAWASRSATTTTTASRISTSPATAATRSIATTATARSPTSPASAGVGGGGWSASAGFFDYDNDGRLDLFVTRYVDWSFQKNRYCGEKKPGYRAYCHPDNFEAATNILYRNNGDGTFTDVSAKAGIAGAAGQGPRRGVRRLRRRRLRRTSTWPTTRCSRFLFHNNGDGTFTEVGLLAGVGFNEDGKTFAGMGVDFADYDNDGQPDIVVTDLSNERYRLFRQNGDGSFRDVTNASGVGGATLPFSGWSTRFFDYDNDGWKDLFVAQGHVMDTIEKTVAQPELPAAAAAAAQRARAVSSGSWPGDAFQKDWAGRGAAFGDLDNDGDIDVVVSNVGQKAVVLRNDGGNAQNWLAIRTVGTTIEPRRHRLPGEGRVRRPGLTQYFTDHHRGRLPVGERQAAAGRARRRRHGEARRDSLAVGRRPDIRERQGRDRR